MPIVKLVAVRVLLGVWVLLTIGFFLPIAIRTVVEQLVQRLEGKKRS